MLRKINNKSDFDFRLRLLDADGKPVGWIEANWELVLYTTSKNFAYTASYAYGEKTNCANDDGEILILVDRHTFPVGELHLDFAIDIPDKSFPDGSRHVEVPGESTDIELVLERGQEVTGMEITIRVPHLKQPEPESTDTDTGKKDTETNNSDNDSVVE